MNNTIKRHQSSSMEMIYFWLLDGEAQNYFKFHYQPGQDNLGDYRTKYFTGKYTQREKPFYVHEPPPSIWLVF